MNQTIHILDGFTYVKDQQAMMMKASLAGQSIICYVNDIDVRAADAFYHEYQFDIEEALVDLIEDHQWNEKGEIWLSAVDVSL